MSGLIGFIIIAGLAAVYIAILVRQDKKKHGVDTHEKSSKRTAIGIIVGILIFLISFVAVAAIKEAGRTSDQTEQQPTVQELQNSLDAVKAE